MEIKTFSPSQPLSLSTPTEVRDLSALRERVNARLPEGMSVNAAVDTDANGVQHIVLYPQGFAVDPITGEFRTPGLRVGWVSFSASLSDVDIPDVYIDGHTVADIVRREMDTDLREHIGANDPTDSDLHRIEVEDADDVYVSVQVSFAVDQTLTADDLGIEDDVYEDEDVADEAVREAITQFLMDAFVVSHLDIDEIDISQIQYR